MTKCSLKEIKAIKHRSQNNEHFSINFLNANDKDIAVVRPHRF